MLLKILLPFTDFLWILQKEEYENRRYIHWLRKFFFRRNFVVSERLVYTPRLQITLVVAIGIWFLSLGTLFISVSDFFLRVAVLLLWVVLIPAFVGMTNLVLAPLFLVAHYRTYRQAARVVRRYAGLRCVAVVGSYGKTTTKHFLFELLRFNYRTQMIPGTINTTSGIAAWILRELSPHTEILIVEMDAYHPGEIAQSVRMVPPDFAIITSIGEQHLERFGDRETLAAALGEVVQYAPQEAVIVGDTKTLNQVKELRQNRTFVETDTGSLRYMGSEIRAEGLSRSNKENLARALTIASRLSIPPAFVQDTVASLKLPDRRQQVTTVYGYEGIDDSYNISLSTARAGLEAARSLADVKNKKLLVIAAGIPELGPQEQDGNQKLGTAIASFADYAVVLNSMFAPEIIRGLGTRPHSVYARFSDFLLEADRFPKTEWVILLEPTLPDLYY